MDMETLHFRIIGNRELIITDNHDYAGSPRLRVICDTRPYFKFTIVGTFNIHPRVSSLAFRIGVTAFVGPRVTDRRRTLRLLQRRGSTGLGAYTPRETLLHGSVIVARWSVGAGWFAGEEGCGGNSETEGLKPGDGSHIPPQS